MTDHTLAERRERAEKVCCALEELYPEAECSLTYEGEGWRLMVMGRLSAQCTDARVNIVCCELFSRFPTAKALGDAPIEEIEEIVHPCGLFHVKARDIKEECRKLAYEYDSVVPNDMEELLTFPGVGRKIANLLLGDLYGADVIVADTHCIRISNRLGLVADAGKDPAKVERRLLEVMPEGKCAQSCHRFVLFGRDICSARAPQCERCPMSGFCPEALSNKK